MFDQKNLSKLILWLMAAYAVMLCGGEAWAQMTSPSPATQYLESFLDHPPSEAEQARLPAGARDVIIAKVRFVSKYSGRGRHGECYNPPCTYLFGVAVKILDVLMGTAVLGDRSNAWIGVRGSPNRFKTPHTPEQKVRDYFIISYIGEDNERRLVEFPISENEYTEWEKEVWSYERERNRPGVRD